jgi:hypothetical protein
MADSPLIPNELAQLAHTRLEIGNHDFRVRDRRERQRANRERAATPVGAVSLVSPLGTNGS